jgi:hypothetical protein
MVSDTVGDSHFTWLSRHVMLVVYTCVAAFVAARGVLVAGPSSASASLILFREPPLAYGAASDTTPIAVAPLSPSGPADLVAVDRRVPGSIMVRLGNGDGTFGEAVDYPVTGTVRSILVTDVNKDGKPDARGCARGVGGRG